MSLFFLLLGVVPRPLKGNPTASTRFVRFLRRAAPVAITTTLGTLVLASLWRASTTPTRGDHPPLPLAIDDYAGFDGGADDSGGNRGGGAVDRELGPSLPATLPAELLAAPPAATKPPALARRPAEVGPRPLPSAKDAPSWPPNLDATYATAFISPKPSAELATVLARLAGSLPPAHPHPKQGPLHVSVYAQWYRETNPTALTLRLARLPLNYGRDGGGRGSIPGAFGIGWGLSAASATTPLGRPACAGPTTAGDVDDRGKSDEAMLAVFGGGPARWYVNAAGRVVRVGADGVGALVDVGGGAKEGDWPDDPPLATAATARTIPFSVATGGVDVASPISGPYMGKGMIVHLGQHHGTTFFHVYNEVLPRLLAVLPLLRAFPESRVLLPPSAVTRKVADIVGVPASQRAPAPPDHEWVPAAIVVAPPPVQQTVSRGVYPECGAAAVATFLRAVLAPPTPVARSGGGGVTAVSSDAMPAGAREPPRTLLWISRSVTTTAATHGESARCTGKRCVANEAAVIAGLAAALGDGWTVSVFPHNGGLEGAVRAFGARPDLIVGVHGAGWQNMVFAGAAPSPLPSAAGPRPAARTTPVAIHISSGWRPNFFAPTAIAAGYRWARLYHKGVTHYETGLEMDVGRLVDAVQAVVRGTFDYSSAAWERQRQGRGVAAVKT